MNSTTVFGYEGLGCSGYFIIYLLFTKSIHPHILWEWAVNSKTANGLHLSLLR